MNTTLPDPKDLTQEAPCSPRQRIHDYVILGRTLDKCRSFIAGTLGEYHFDCPLDNMLFGFKEVRGADFKAHVEPGVSDEEVAAWLDKNGLSKTPQEVREWSARLENYRPFEDLSKREWFEQECAPLGIDPKTSTLFDYLDADDAAFSSLGSK